eukprot:10721871-Lingulodinium_polyedra.AAC.1
MAIITNDTVMIIGAAITIVQGLPSGQRQWCNGVCNGIMRFAAPPQNLTAGRRTKNMFAHAPMM